MAINAGMMKDALARKMMPEPAQEEGVGGFDEREAFDLQEVVSLLEGVESDNPESNSKLKAIIESIKQLIEEDSNPAPVSPDKNSEQVPQEPV